MTEDEEGIHLVMLYVVFLTGDYFVLTNSTITEEDIVEEGALENKQSNVDSDSAIANGALTSQDEKDQTSKVMNDEEENPENIKDPDSSLSTKDVSTEIIQPENIPSSTDVSSPTTSETSVAKELIAADADPSEIKTNNIEQAPDVSSQEVTKQTKKMTYSQIIKNGRKFNIDLTSKVMTFLTLHLRCLYKLEQGN